MIIGFVVPTYNEERLLPDTIEGLQPYVNCVVIVNDGSTDKTLDVAKKIQDQYKEKITTIDLGENCGQGKAITTGIKYLLKTPCTHIGIIAGDNQCDQNVILYFKQALLNGYSLVKGSRFLTDKWNQKTVPSFRFWGNIFVSYMAKFFLGWKKLSDPLHGYLLAEKSLFEKMALDNIAEGYDIEISMLFEFKKLCPKTCIVPSPPRYGSEVSTIVYKRDIPLILKRLLSVPFRRITTYKWNFFKIFSIGLLTFVFPLINWNKIQGKIMIIMGIIIGLYLNFRKSPLTHVIRNPEKLL